MAIISASQQAVPSYHFYTGDFWWILSAGGLSYLRTVLDSEYDRYLLQAFKQISIPEESFYQAGLRRSSLADQLVNDSVHYSLWGDGAHPLPLSCNDLPVMRKSPKLFARKFDRSVDAHVLAQIDRMLDNEEERRVESPRDLVAWHFVAVAKQPGRKYCGKYCFGLGICNLPPEANEKR